MLDDDPFAPPVKKPVSLEAQLESASIVDLEARIETRPGNFLHDDPGSHYAMALCFNIVHGLQPNENRALLARVNASGIAYMTHTSLQGRFALRLVVGQWRTERSDVELAWRLIRDAGRSTTFSR